MLMSSCNLRYELYPFYNETRLRTPFTLTAAAINTAITTTTIAAATRLPRSGRRPFQKGAMAAGRAWPPRASRPSWLIWGRGFGWAGGDSGWRRVGGGNKTRNIIIIIAVAIAVSVTLAACAAIYLSKRIKRKPHELLEVDELAIDEISKVESLQYDFGKIRAATNDFSDANKLGKGGFGVVYWGKLLSGQEIAVKRLSKNSGQGNIEFKNEVLLVARLQQESG
ncbi:UNVERIFIED_CONTAM: Cysteine-rich receptor-like protein kinase [Sesamum radiatum]|uniref:Cysteine-rich receptor-like protein kinase n=1 Tax=Sesamum radiatum TaxID=300843 RepID=A0AAW2KIB6_SESRA